MRMTEQELTTMIHTNPNLKIKTKVSLTKASKSALSLQNCNPPKKRKQKYNAKEVFYDAIRFDSKKEANRYQDLVLLEKSRAISKLKRQVEFILVPARGGERAVIYKADFVYEQDGKKIVEDVKSPATKTKAYIIKRKIMKYQHPEIQFVEYL